MSHTLSQERLHECLLYLPDTGLFIWTQPNSGRVKVGDVAGTLRFFDTAIEASVAYSEAAQELFGEFAHA